jgi:LytS/YehU family sensor histidine kinase
MGWIAYVIAWLAATLFWTLASASSAVRSPLDVLPFALLAMGPAAVMGLAVWRLTKREPWDWRAPSFYAVHASALAAYSLVYSTSWVWPDLVAGRFHSAMTAVRSSSFQVWNLLLGSWLYLVVAGLSYAVHAQRRVREQEVAVAEAQLLAQEAQLATLRAQVNPHFLFNALHSVGALVTSDPVRADEALERLGDLLRYALGAEDEVLFAQEWRFTQDYLAFEKLRLGDRLRVNVEIDESALSTMVPPLIFQPLVENAVRHGVADRPEGGHIELSARTKGPRLLLRVTNDGAGDIPDTTGGLGLTSVRRRLAALYGDRATIGIEHIATGFTVIVGLPSSETDEVRSAS